MSKGLRRPQKDETLLYNKLHGYFRVLKTAHLQNYPAQKTVKDPEPTNYDGLHIISYEEAVEIVGKQNLADPPEASPEFLANEEAKKIIAKAKADAKKEAAKIKREANADAAKILDSAKKEAESVKNSANNQEEESKDKEESK